MIDLALKERWAQKDGRQRRTNARSRDRTECSYNIDENNHCTIAFSSCHFPKPEIHFFTEKKPLSV